MLGRVLSRFKLGHPVSVAAIAAVGTAAGASSSPTKEDNELSQQDKQSPFSESEINNPELIQAHIVGDEGWTCSQAEYPVKVFKHGEHYDFYGPDKDFSKTMGGSCYFGQLTDLGHQQMRAVGHKLRERYVESEDTKLFSTSDTPSEILHDVSIRSTDSRRTVETVYELILGLTNAKKPEELKKPIEIHVLDASEETMYPRTACEQMKQHFRDSKHNPEFVKAKKEAFGYMDFTQMTPEEERYWKSRAIPAVCNTLSSMTAHKFPLPGGVTEEKLSGICDRSAIEYSVFYGTQKACRLGIGRFLHTLKHGIEEKIKHVENVSSNEEVIGITHNVHIPRMRFYSGHDNTLGPMLLSLGAFDNKHPPMGSTIILELWKQKRAAAAGATQHLGHSRNNDYFVKVLYNFKEIALPGCDKQVLCPIDKFEKILTPLIPKDYHEECKLPVS